MNLLPPDHAERYRLADEVHARPPEALETPSRATHVAVLVAPEQRSAEQAHLAALCAQFGVPAPEPQATQFSADLGSVRLKWERHGEFSGYTLFAAGRSPVPFSEPALSMLPAQWLAGVPGSTIFAAHAKLVPFADDVPSAEFLAAHFDANVPVGAGIGGGSGLAFTDFKIRADGCARFVVLDRGFTPRQAGRMLQRLFEIETYRMMALLALPVAREQAKRIAGIERSLATLTERIAKGGGASGDDESLLQALTGLAAEVESGLAASQFRFGACRAYHDLVTTRISELRERRLPGIQTIEEFMARRFTPAVATCASTSQRLHDLSERVAQACGLLSTRVDIARERQNQMLLESMNRRAKLQLRLQQTVEGLSVAAIVYYVAGLIGYLSKGLKASGARVDPDLVVGLSIPVVAALAVWVLGRARRKHFRAEAASEAREL
jgi:uncharacterized membrane-anchored protein